MKNLQEMTEQEIHQSTYAEIDAIVSTHKDLQDIQYVRFLSISRMVELRKALTNTTQFEKRIEKIQSLYKELIGSEKQIKWATDIRETKTRDFAYQLTLAEYGEILKENNFENEYEIKITNEQVNRKFNFVLSNSAKLIIDNRN